MAKKQNPNDAEPAADATAEIEYCGPPEQESPVFGLLTVGQRYAATVAFGEYLIATHPEYWKRPAATAAG